MIKVSLDYMADFPHVFIIDAVISTQKEIKLFTDKILPSMQKEINIAFSQYQRNSTELASKIREIMNHNEMLEKYKYIFTYYTNENHIGTYWYKNFSEVI